MSQKTLAADKLFKLHCAYNAVEAQVSKPHLLLNTQTRGRLMLIVQYQRLLNQPLSLVMDKEIISPYKKNEIVNVIG